MPHASPSMCVRIGLVAVALIAGHMLAIQTMERTGRGGKNMLAHNVYFALQDNSQQAKEKLVEACRKYLSGHEGEIFFAVGVLADDLQRPVNDRDFDVALHIVFKDRAAHDKYQSHPRHMQFIEENKANWKKVRVFDSYVSSGRE